VEDRSEPERDWFGYPLRPERPASSDQSSSDRPALGREPRSRRQRRLRQIPLVLVLVVNVAVAIAVLAGLDALELPWWQEIQDQPWDQFVIVPLLWPTIAFLALKGVD